MPASTGPTWRNRIGPARRRRLGDGVDDGAARAANCSSSTSSSTDRTGVTQVSAPASSATQRVAVPGGEGGGEVRPDLVLDLVVELVVDPLLAPEQPAQVGVELGLDGPHGQPAAVGRPVGAVAGVAAGDDVVPVPDRAPVARCSSTASDVSHSTPSAMDTSRWVPGAGAARAPSRRWRP